MSNWRTVVRIIIGLAVAVGLGGLSATFTVYWAWRTATPDTPSDQMESFRAYAHGALVVTAVLVGGGLYLIGSALLPALRRWYEAKLLNEHAHERQEAHRGSNSD